jgi:hypothetical protein
VAVHLVVGSIGNNYHNATIYGDMNHSQRAHRVTRWIAAAALLFMQITVAAHACPVITSGAGMSADCLNSLDTEQPNLCKAHGESHGSLHDRTRALSLAPALSLPTTLLVAARAVDDVGAPRHASYMLSRLANDGSPPIFLRLSGLRT